MNFRDALLADHGADRLSVEADRRLRQRLGLEAAASTRRAWLRPAFAGLAVAAIALVVIFYPQKQRPDGVRADQANVTIAAAPGTHVTRTSANTVLLTRGAITVERSDAKPMVVDVPMGRVVIAAYHSSITADRDFVTILLSDGSGHYDDANGQSHPLAPNTPFVWPPPAVKTASPETPTPVVPLRKPAGRPNIAPAPPAPASPASSDQPIPLAPPGETPPSVSPRPDMPCTFKSDCDDGQTCRKNERGDSVCMGNGDEGAACWFDNDCVSQHCVQRRCVSSAPDQ